MKNNRNNYILNLQQQVEDLKEEKRRIREKLDDLYSYLTSEKFQGIENHWINPDDVLNRLPTVFGD